MIETAGRLVANRHATRSGVTAPYGRIDDTGRVEVSQEALKKTGADSVTLAAKPSGENKRNTDEKSSRMFDVQKNNQVKNNLRGVPDADPQACFNRSTWSPAINMQQPTLGTSHLELGDSLDLLDHHGDGPAISNGGANEPRKDP